MKRALVIEDDLEMLDLITITLSQAFQVKPLNWAGNAINEMREFRPHLVLLDVHVQGAHGFEVVEAMRKDISLRSIPVLMLSSRHDAWTQEKAIQSGANAFMRKPFSTDELLEKASSLV